VTSADEPFQHRPAPFDPWRAVSLMDAVIQSWTSTVSADDADLAALLSRAANDVLGFDGAALSMMTGPGRGLFLGASDAASATAARLQFTVGEGPCFEAYTEQCPVTGDEDTMLRCWPVLAIMRGEQTPFESSLSIPLGGTHRFGVLDLYLRRSRPISVQEIDAAHAIAYLVTDVLLDSYALSDPAHEDGTTNAGTTGNGSCAPAWWDNDTTRARHQVWVAVGMLNLTLGMAADDALALLRARAISEGRTVDALAHDVVLGTLDVA